MPTTSPRHKPLPTSGHVLRLPSLAPITSLATRGAPKPPGEGPGPASPCRAPSGGAVAARLRQSRAEQSRATCPRQAAAWRCAPAHLPHTNGPAGRSWPRPAFKPTEASIGDRLLTSHQRAGVQPRTVPSRHVKKIRACSQLVSTKGKRPRCQAGGVPVPGRARYFQPHPTSPPV